MEPISGSVAERYMTEAEVAAELGVSRRTVRQWHAQGEAPPRTKIGARLLFERDAFHAWLRSKREAGR